MIIIIQLAAELQVQLAAKLIQPLADVGRLGLQVLVVIITDSSHKKRLPFYSCETGAIGREIS